MNALIKRFSGLFVLVALALLISGCKPSTTTPGSTTSSKTSMPSVTGIWAATDQSRIVILDSTGGVRVLRQTPGPGAGIAYTSVSGKIKAGAAGQVTADIAGEALLLNIPATAPGNPITVLSMTETAGGKAVQSELHRVSAPAASQVKTLGFADSGNGTLEIRAQPKLSFSYAIKEQDGLRCYALTANGRPRLTLHLFSGKDGALCALISNDKDGNAYLLTFTAQPGEGGSVTMKTVKEAGTEKQMRLDISAEKGALSIREI